MMRLRYLIGVAVFCACPLPSPSVSGDVGAGPDAGAIVDAATGADASAPGDAAQPPPGSDGGAPIVTGVLPAAGPAGTCVTVVGAGFLAGAIVQFEPPSGPMLEAAANDVEPNQLDVCVPADIDAPSSLCIHVRNGEMPSSGCTARFTVTTGRTLHVSPTGDDGAAGDAAAPWKTLTFAFTRLLAGDLLLVHAGTYTEEQLELHTSGTEAQPIVVSANPGDSPLLDHSASATATDTLRLYGNYIIINGLRITNHHHPGTGLLVSGETWSPDALYDTVSRCEIFGALGQGLQTSGHHALIYRNDIHDNGVADATEAKFDHGIYNEGGDNVFRSNRIHGNTGWGIQLYHGDSGVAEGSDLIERNLIYSNGIATAQLSANTESGGIIVANRHPNETIRNNIVCGNAKTGIDITDAEANANIEGNVTCFNEGVGLYMKSGAGGGDSLSGNVSYADDPFALTLAPGIVADHDVFFAPGAAPNFGWSASTSAMDLAALQAISGQEAHGRIADPLFHDVPQTGFDATRILDYDFCTDAIPALCTPLP